MPIVSLAAACYFFYIDLLLLSIVTVVYALITFLFYRKYFDYRYKGHFDKFIKTTYSKRIGNKTTLEFLNNHILGKDETGETKLKNEQVDYVADFPKYFFIHLKIGEVIIISKEKVDASKVKQKLEAQGFVVVDELKWQWGQNKYL